MGPWSALGFQYNTKRKKNELTGLQGRESSVGHTELCVQLIGEEIESGIESRKVFSVAHSEIIETSEVGLFRSNSGRTLKFLLSPPPPLVEDQRKKTGRVIRLRVDGSTNTI